MNIQIINKNNTEIAEFSPEGKELLLTDEQSVLNLITAVHCSSHANRIILPKKAITGKFFILSTGLAGELLQKFVNYDFKIAIFGDFSHYTSRPLQDFMRESNQGNEVFFVPTEEEAIERLSQSESA